MMSKLSAMHDMEINLDRPDFHSPILDK